MDSKQNKPFIHYRDLYSTTSRLLLRSAPDPRVFKRGSFEVRIEHVSEWSLSILLGASMSSFSTDWPKAEKVWNPNECQAKRIKSKLHSAEWSQLPPKGTKDRAAELIRSDLVFYIPAVDMIPRDCKIPEARLVDLLTSDCRFSYNYRCPNAD